MSWDDGDEFREAEEKRKREAAFAVPTGSDAPPELPKLDEMVKRMLEEETIELAAREMRQAREVIEALDAAIKAGEWKQAQEYIIVLNWKTGTISAQCDSMRRRQNPEVRRGEKGSQ